MDKPSFGPPGRPIGAANLAIDNFSWAWLIIHAIVFPIESAAFRPNFPLLF
jgi:hypothetical protein